MKRKTVLAHIRGAVDRLDRAIRVAAKSDEINNGEIIEIRRELQATRKLADRLKRASS